MCRRFEPAPDHFSLIVHSARNFARFTFESGNVGFFVVALSGDWQPRTSCRLCVPNQASALAEVPVTLRPFGPPAAGRSVQ